MPNKLRTPLFLALLVCFSTALISCGDSDKQEKSLIRPVKTMTVADPLSTITRIFPGKVLATDEAKLAFEVPGQVIQLPILEGDKVKKGQMLAALEPKIYQEKVNETKAILVRSEAEYTRAGTLVKDGYVSKTEYDQKRAAYLVAKANFNAAEKDLKETKLVAPFDGIIAKRYVKNFENVKAKEVVILLQNIQQLDIEINVPENIIMNLRREKKQQIESTASFENAPNREFALKIKEFSAQADPETQTYRVIFSFPAPTDINVLPGMTASVKVPLPGSVKSAESFYLIPSAAVFDGSDGKPSVWVVDKKTLTVKRRIITVSRFENGSVRVLKGLQPGDEIVTAGAVYLRENQQVSIMQPLPGNEE